MRGPPPERPKVFIANKSYHNYSDAARFGDIVFVTEGDVNKFQIGKIYRDFEEALKESTERDFFVPTGLPILVGIGSAILAYKHGLVRYLLFKRGNYQEITVDLRNL
jgi:hypothetical protein